MRHYDYRLTLKLSAGGKVGRGAHAEEALHIEGSALSFSRHYLIDPAARGEAPPDAARWTPDEEGRDSHAA